MGQSRSISPGHEYDLTGPNDQIADKLRQGAPREPVTMLRFTPFDPAPKMAEVIAIHHDGRELRVVKGAPAAVATVALMTREIDAELQRLDAAGYRTLGVTCGPSGKLAFIGLIAFGDPPGADSRALLAQLQSLGLRCVSTDKDRDPLR